MGKADAIHFKPLLNDKGVVINTLTDQSAKNDCDINLIMERALRGADISHLQKPAPMFIDMTGLPDYRQAMLIVTEANNAFMSLDANVRERFANDPAKLIDFLNDEKNRDEAVRLGLVKAPEKAPDPDPVHETLKSIDNTLKSQKPAKRHKDDQDE